MPIITIILLLLWALAGLATIALIITSIVLMIMKKRSMKLWIGAGVSAVIFVVLFVGIAISSPSDQNQPPEIATTNEESDNEPIQTELSKEREREEARNGTQDGATGGIEAEEVEVEESEEIDEFIAEIDERIEERKEEEKDLSNYRNDVDIKDIERNPNEYQNELIAFEGKIIQVIEDGELASYRIAVNDDYDKIVLLSILSSDLESRLLEDDYIDVYATFDRLITYETVIGANRTIPSFTTIGERITLQEDIVE